MEEMNLSEAAAIIQGVVRFQRAMARLGEALETTLEAESRLRDVDKQVTERKALVATLEDEVANLNKVIKSKNSLAKEVKDQVAMLASIKEEIEGALIDSANLSADVNHKQKALDTILVQTVAAQEAEREAVQRCEEEQGKLADLQQQKAELLSKFA